MQRERKKEGELEQRRAEAEKRQIAGENYLGNLF